MHTRRRWKQAVLVGLLAMGLAGVPQSALARDRCDNQRYSDSYAYRTGGNNRGYRDNAYRNNNYPYESSRYRNDRYSYGDYSESRSAGKSAAIIGGSAAAGAVVGGLTGGKKGAIIGGAIGGVGGLIYDRTTRDRDRSRW